jgi:hypothetical protein
MDISGLSRERKIVMPSLYEYAENELTRAGLLEDSDNMYGDMIGTAVLEVVKVFSEQGHSGMSAELSIAILEKLLRYEPLSPLTFESDEWFESRDGIYQNRRKFTVFSNDELKTWYDINEEGCPRHLITRTENAET